MSPASTRADRTAWLASHFGNLPNDPAARIVWLERRCRTMRAQGIAGHWAYDLPLHRELFSILQAERCAGCHGKSSGPPPEATAGRLVPA